MTAVRNGDVTLWWSWRGRRRQDGPQTPGADCGVELLPDTPLGIPDWCRYLVHDHVWADAG